MTLPLFFFHHGPNIADVLPTSDPWDCLDFNDSNMAALFTHVEVSQSRGTPWVFLDGNDDLNLFSDDGLESSIEIDLAVTQDFTFEFNIIPQDLPPNLGSLDTNRVFVATFDSQDNAGGILISETGLAFVSAFGNSVTPIPGSQNIFAGNSSNLYTVRLVVDGVNNTMDVYITLTSDIASSGHVLRYTTPAPITAPFTAMDSIRLEAFGTSSAPTDVRFDSIRLACTVLIPNRRPVADAGTDLSFIINSIIRLDGTNSFDPEGSVLTYDWTLLGAPLGSRYRISGTGAFTTEDAIPDGDDFTDTIKHGGTPWSTTNAPDLQPGDMIGLAGALYEIATVSDSQLTVVGEVVPEGLTGENWYILHQSTFFQDNTLPDPTFIPYVAGLFTIQLVVNDGELDSLPTSVLCNVSETSVPKGSTPDLSFMFRFLSDFWNLVEDRDHIVKAWEGFAQIASAQLLTAWQVDYNKSLKDIQRLFQRRWLDFETVKEETDIDGATVSFIRGPIVGSADISGVPALDGLTLILSRVGEDDVTVTFSTPASTLDIKNQIKSAMGFLGRSPELAAIVDVGGGDERLVISDPDFIVVRSTGTANTLLGFSTTADQSNDLQGSLGVVSSNRNFVVSDVGIDFTELVDPNDLLIISDVNHLVQKVAKPKILTTLESSTFANVTTTAAFTYNDDNGSGNSEITRGSGSFLNEGYEPNLDVTITGTTSNNATHRILSVSDGAITFAGIVLTDEGPVSSTLLQNANWIIPSIVTSTTIDFSEELVVSGDLVLFQIREKTGDVTFTEVVCPVVGAKDNTVGFNPEALFDIIGSKKEDWIINFVGIRHLNNIPIDDLILGIPCLQELLIEDPPVWRENGDYVIGTLNGVNAIQFESGTFSESSLPPDRLWAEVSYLDNKPTIENNFGALVEFKIEDLETRTDDLDYLSAVRGLWYAFFSGPSLNNVRIGTQILLGLPFAEVAGTIVDINSEFSSTDGRLLVADKSDPEIIRAYLYPKIVGIEDNPDTGVPYTDGDTVTQFAPLSKGVDIVDYEKNPRWFEGLLNQGSFLEIEKYFKFQMIANVDAFNLTNLIFAIDFVKKIKPTYTFPLFIVRKDLGFDEIDVVDVITTTGTLFLYDEAGCVTHLQGQAFRWDDPDGAGVVTNAYDDASPFLYDQGALCIDDNVTALQYATWPGGTLTYDWIWAFDNGPSDITALSGPAPTPPPPPMGALVGQIAYGDTLGAGVYSRLRQL